MDYFVDTKPEVLVELLANDLYAFQVFVDDTSYVRDNQLNQEGIGVFHRDSKRLRKLLNKKPDIWKHVDVSELENYWIVAWRQSNLKNIIEELFYYRAEKDFLQKLMEIDGYNVELTFRRFLISGGGRRMN